MGLSNGTGFNRQRIFQLRPNIHSSVFSSNLLHEIHGAMAYYSWPKSKMVPDEAESVLEASLTTAYSENKYTALYPLT